MRTLNKAMLLGSVGKDPEIRSTSGGTVVATFSLATTRRYKDGQGNWKDETDWHNIKAFARTAEVVRDYVQKGTQVHVEGRLTTETWEKDGQKHYKTMVVVDELILLGGRDKTTTGSRQVSATNPAPSRQHVFPEQEISDDDIPF